MNNFNTNDTSSFLLEGLFLGFIWEGSKIKYLRIAIAEDELTIKLSKEARASCKTVLKPNNIIQVIGESKLDSKTGEIRFKAYQLCPKTEATLEVFENGENSLSPEKITPVSSNSNNSKNSKKVKLLICQKSGCQKKGGKRQHQAIEAILRDRGLHQSVIFQETGCLGKCSMAPNIVLMPSKKRLSGMKPEAIADLISLTPVND